MNRSGIRLLLTTALLAAAAPAIAESFDCTADPALVVQVGSQTSGLLEQVFIKRGDVVKQGQEIARLASGIERTTVDLMTEQATSTAEIEAQQARYDLVAGRLERTRELAANDVASEDKLQQAIAEMEVVKRELTIAQMRHRVAELELIRAQKQLEQRSILSSIDGLVVDRHLFNGEYLAPDGKLATIAQLDPLLVEAFLPTKYFTQVAVGMEAIIEFIEPSARRVGKVTVVDKVFDAASSTFGIRVELPNPNSELPAGSRCTLTLVD